MPTALQMLSSSFKVQNAPNSLINFGPLFGGYFIGSSDIAPPFFLLKSRAY